jgi:hypothetical protein
MSPTHLTKLEYFDYELAGRLESGFLVKPKRGLKWGGLREKRRKDTADIGVTSPSFRYPGIPEGVSEHLGKALAKETEFPLLRVQRSLQGS